MGARCQIRREYHRNDIGINFLIIRRGRRCDCVTGHETGTPWTWKSQVLSGHGMDLFFCWVCTLPPYPLPENCGSESRCQVYVGERIRTCDTTEICRVKDSVSRMWKWNYCKGNMYAICAGILYVIYILALLR